MIKKTYRKLLFVFLTLITVNAFAQADDAAIRQVVNQLFTGMKQSDSALIRAAFTEAPVLQTIVRNREGKTVIVTEPLDSFLTGIMQKHTDVYDERIVFDVIKIDGELAMVWAPYKFYLGDRFSHCGVDSFQLVKINGAWKIQYLIDTRRRQNCE